MVTPRNFGKEVVLRVVPSSCNIGCQRTSFELLVKKATSHLLALRVSVRHRLHSATFVMASWMAAEERNIVGKHGHLHVFGYDSPKVVDVQQEEERQQDRSLRESLA